MVTDELKKQAAQEEIAETIDKTVKNLPPWLPKDRKETIVAENIQSAQHELLQ
jgi:hypothetical protein